MLFAKKVRILEDHADLLRNSDKRLQMRDDLDSGDVFIVKNVFPRAKLIQLRDYLRQIGQSSLPNYQKIEKGAPNFHRMNVWDERSYVPGCFHQFSFFPWNQDIFHLFELARDVYRMRNLLSNLEPDKFLQRSPEDGCTARLSIQFYPKSIGGLNNHVDPFDFHQFVVPIVIMSKKGVDFHEGGAFVETSDGRRLIVDDEADIGDVVYFSAQMPHGVERIDPKEEPDWASFRGRWIMLIAVNRLMSNLEIADAINLENSV